MADAADFRCLLCQRTLPLASFPPDVKSLPASKRNCNDCFSKIRPVSSDSFHYTAEDILRFHEAIPTGGVGGPPKSLPPFPGVVTPKPSIPPLPRGVVPSSVATLPASFGMKFISVEPAPAHTQSPADLEKESLAMTACAQAVTKELDMKRLFVKILQSARDLIQAERYSLFLVDSNASELYSLIADGAPEIRFPMNEGIAGHVLHTGEVALVRDVQSDTRFKADVDKETGFITRDMLCAPITYDGEKVGVIQCLNAARGAFDQNDIRLIRLLTIFCGIGIGNARIFQKALQEKEKTLLMFEFAKVVAGNESDISVTVQAFMDRTRTLLSADRCTVMLVDEDTQELYTTKADGVEGFRVPIDAGIAGHVAKTGRVLNIRNAYEDPRFNRDIDTKTGYRTASILCMPLRAEGKTIGVAQMVNKLGAPGYFTVDDEKIFSTFASFCAIIIRNAQMQQSMKYTQRQVENVLHVAMALGESSDTKALMSSIMQRACSLIDADRFSVFTYDEMTHTLSRSQEALGGSLEGPDIRFSADSGIAGHVARTGEVVNVSDAYQDPRFNPTVDIQTGYKTQSILAMPIVDEQTGKVVAVAQLVNKKSSEGGSTAFRKEDKDLMRAFAQFCGKGISLDKPIEYIQTTDETLDNFVKKYSVSDPERALLLSWNIEPWRLTYGKLTALIFEMFRYFNLIDTFNINTQKLYRFALEVSRRYHRSVPYHNFVHAFDVTHAMFMYIKEANLKDAYLTDVDILTLFIATMLHDADHQGLTNAFHSTTDSPFAMAYRNGSIMESHHVSVGVSLLSNEDCNILAGCTPDVHKTVWQALIPTILATDAANKKDDDEFNAMIAAKNYSVENVFNRRLLMRQLIRLADVSNAIRPWEVCKYWAGQVSAEFYSQGDAERARGMTVTPLMDRNLTPLPKMQIGFLNFVAKPAFVQMSKFVAAFQPLVDQVERNLGLWQSLSAA